MLYNTEWVSELYKKIDSLRYSVDKLCSDVVDHCTGVIETTEVDI